SPPDSSHQSCINPSSAAVNHFRAPTGISSLVHGSRAISPMRLTRSRTHAGVCQSSRPPVFALRCSTRISVHADRFSIEPRLHDTRRALVVFADDDLDEVIRGVLVDAGAVEEENALGLLLDATRIF